jgi:hypothetical protein
LHPYSFPRVGIVATSSTDDLFLLLASSLQVRGTSKVFRLDAKPHEKSRVHKRKKLLSLIDATLSRLLSGEVVPSSPTTSPKFSVLSLKDSKGTRLFESIPIDEIFTFGKLPEDISDYYCRHLPTVYVLCVGSAQDSESGQYGLTEVLAREPVVMLRLERHVEQGPPQILAEMAVQTNITSATHTRATLLATLPIFLSMALQKIDFIGFTQPTKPSIIKFKDLNDHALSMYEFFSHTARLVRTVAERATTRHQWLLAVMSNPKSGKPNDWQQLRPLIPPTDRFWADPFLVSHEGKNWIFFEEALFKSGKGVGIGHIAVASIDADGFTGPIMRALDLPWHLSYPNVFRHGDDWYMIPESGSQKRIDLYKCEKWPNQWVYHSTLINNYQGYDASITQVGESYWMFVARRVHGVATADLLDLFQALSPLGPWQLHASSPVVMDVRSARPGGRPFSKNGSIVRPAQDSSAGIYGRALRFQEILQIDHEGFRERTQSYIEPNQAEGIIGVHCYAATDDLVVVDICRKVSRIEFFRRFQSRMPKKLIFTTLQL